MERINPEGKFEKGQTPEEREHLLEEELEWLVDLWRPIVRIMEWDVFTKGFPELKEVEEIKEQLIGYGKPFKDEDGWNKFIKMEEHLKKCQKCGRNFEDVFNRSLR
jgi:hypothetical protein